MPVWPKSIYTFGVNLKTAGVEWKLLRKKRAGPAFQEKALGNLTKRLALASYWQTAGIEAGMPYADFRTRVPLQSLEQLDDEQADETAELNERMSVFRGSLLARYPVLDDPWHPAYREMLVRNRSDIRALLQSAPTGPDLSAMAAQQDQLLLRSAQLERAFWLSRVVRAEILWRPTQEQRAQLDQLRRCEQTSLPVTTLTPRE